jgi:hypothetical protein
MFDDVDPGVRQEALDFLEETIQDEESRFSLAHARAAAIAAGLTSKAGTLAFRAFSRGTGLPELEEGYAEYKLDADETGDLDEYPKTFRTRDDRYLQASDLRFGAGKIVELGQRISESEKTANGIKRNRRLAAIVAIGSLVGGVIEYNRRKEG